MRSAARSLFAHGDEFAKHGEFAVFDGRRENQAGDRVAVGKQRFYEGLEVGEAGGGHFEKEVVAAGEVVALADFFEGLHVFEEAMVVLAGTAHADEGEDLEAEGFAVDLCGVAVKDADLFHLLEAFAGCGGRQANAARHLGEAETGVCLKFVEELSSMNVE